MTIRPLQARLDILHNQWVSFAEDPHARLLVWRARQDERGMIDAFVDRECDPERAQTPDLFLQLVSPWGPAHGARLAAELVAQSEEAELDWRWSGGGDDTAALLGALTSLRSRLGDRMLAVWLEPSADVDAGYTLWLQRLAHAAPEGIRFFVLGDFAALVRAEPERVRAVACDLDMATALEELTDQAGGATPDNVFRRLQTRLNAQLNRADLPGASETVARAIALADGQGWPEPAITLQLIMAAAFAGEARHVDAVAAYRDAERRAGQLQDATARAKLRLIALMGCGSVLFAARAYGPALETYLRAAALAEESEDAQSELDAFQMAVACCAERGEREQAWTHGVSGLRAAAKLSLEERERSTFAALLERLRDLFRGDPRQRALHDQLTALGRA